MTVPSNGITADVIREMMPPYRLSDDLLGATLAALPPPPADAPMAWRRAHVTRLAEEISTLMPANAAQARIAAQVLIFRELAETIVARAYAPELTVAQMCRLARTAAEVERTATAMLRTLERCQQKPAPFFGTVLSDGVDVAALDAEWGKGTVAAGSGASVAAGAVEPRIAPQPATGVEPVQPRPDGADAPCAQAAGDAAPVAQGEGSRREQADDRLAAALPADDAGPYPAVPAMLRTAGREETVVPVRLGRSAGSAADPGLPGGSTPEGIVTRLDNGPGWTLDVVRARTGVGAEVGEAPGR